jgi:hypothetical protein
MHTPTSPPANRPPAARTSFTYALLAAAIGAVTSTLTVFAAFFVLNPTVITQASSIDDFTFSLTFLGGLHMLFCGPPGCLVGALAAAVPGLLIARSANRSRGAFLVVLASAFVIGVGAGIVTQWGMLQLYALIFPGGISFQPQA